MSDKILAPQAIENFYSLSRELNANATAHDHFRACKDALEAHLKEHAGLRVEYEKLKVELDESKKNSPLQVVQ